MIDLYKFIIAFILFGLTSFQSFSQLDSTWVNIYGGNRDDISSDFIQTNDSGFLFIGSTSSFGFNNSQMYFLKLDSNGAIEWSKSHGGDGQDWGTSVIQTSDNGFLGVGYSNSYGAGGFDIYLVKLDNNGALEYERYYGGIDWDFAWDVIEYAPQEYIIGGETQSYGAGGKDGWVIKYNEYIDSFEWSKTIGNSGSDAIKSITRFKNGTISCTGYYTQIDSTHTDLMYLNLTPNGQTVNTLLTFGDSLDDGGNDILMFSDSTLVFTGYKTIEDTSRTYTIRLDSQNSVLFEETWTLGEFAEGKSVLERPDHNPGILSSFYSTNVGFEFWYVFMGYNGSGTNGSLSNDYATRMIYSKNGFYLMAGHTEGYDSSFPNLILYKTDTGSYDPSNLNLLNDNVNVVGIKEYNPIQFNLTLNNSLLQLDFERSIINPLNMIIYNSNGQIILNDFINHYQSSISVSSLKSGIYFIKVFDQHCNMVKPFIITN